MYFAFCLLSFHTLPLSQTHTHTDKMPYHVSVQQVSLALMGWKREQRENETERKYEMRKRRRAVTREKEMP